MGQITRRVTPHRDGNTVRLPSQYTVSSSERHVSCRSLHFFDRIDWVNRIKVAKILFILSILSKEYSLLFPQYMKMPSEIWNFMACTANASIASGGVVPGSLNLAEESLLSPHRAFMKSAWDSKQQPSDAVKYTPQNQYTDGHLNNFHDAGQMKAFDKGRLFQRCQTTGTEHPVVMLADTLAAEEALTLRAASRRFA